MSNTDASHCFWDSIHALLVLSEEEFRRTSAFQEMLALCDCSPVTISASELLDDVNAKGSFTFDNVDELFMGALTVLELHGKTGKAKRLQRAIDKIQQELLTKSFMEMNV